MLGFNISTAAAERLLIADASEDISLSNLESTTGVEIEVSQTGKIKLWGPRRSLNPVRDEIMTWARMVDGYITEYMEVPNTDRFADLKIAMSEIIEHCGGPVNRMEQEKLVQLYASSLLQSTVTYPPIFSSTSPSTTPAVRLTGPPQLVRRIIQECASLDWLERMVIEFRCEIPSHKVVPVMQSQIHGLEPLIDFSRHAGRVEVRLLSNAQALTSRDSLSDTSSGVVYRCISLCGPRRGVRLVLAEIEVQLCGLVSTCPVLLLIPQSVTVAAD